MSIHRSPMTVGFVCTVPTPRVRFRTLCLCSLVSFFLSTVLVGYAQASTPTDDVKAFFQGLVGEWVGTCEQTTNGQKVDNKYFHAVVTQSDSITYQVEFDYYRLDKKTGAPVPVGTSTMTTTIAEDGTATNHVTGKGEVLIDPNTTKPEQHELTETLNPCLSGELKGNGGGNVKVSGLPLGAGKNGKVKDYKSTWTREGKTLKVCQELSVGFKVLIFGKSFRITATYTAQPGSDVAALMRDEKGSGDT